MIVTGEHGVVQQVLHFDFCLWDRAEVARVATPLRGGMLGPPTRDRCLHAPGFGTGLEREILELLGIGLQVDRVRGGSFDPLVLISGGKAAEGPSPTER